MESMVFIIPSDVIKSSGYRLQILYTSSGIINPVDPLASAYNLYVYVDRPYLILQKNAIEITVFMN